MNVCSDRSADRQTVCACLLLSYTPVRSVSVRTDQIASKHVGPGNPSLHTKKATRLIQATRSIEVSHVQQNRAGVKLVPAHCMSSARDSDGFPAYPRLAHGADDVFSGLWLDHS